MHTGLYVVMGVCGSGKTVIGTEFARALGVEFVEGDDYHPAENVQRMAAGIPLTDEDRGPWLDALAARLREARTRREGLVMSCSALKRKYRDVLRTGAPRLQLIFLDGPKAVIEERMQERSGHYMPASLLESQLATLERPARDEHAWVCDITSPPRRIVGYLLEKAIG